jgi:DNA polymerase III alpha subunit
LDIDFCQAGAKKHRLWETEVRKERVAQFVTLDSFGAKTVIRDIARGWRFRSKNRTNTAR